MLAVGQGKLLDDGSVRKLQKKGDRVVFVATPVQRFK